MPTYVASENYKNRLQRVEPLAVRGDPEASWRQLRDFVNSMERTEIITETENYIHAVHRSKFFGFIDDLMFRLCTGEGIIHARSASRICIFWDFGVNRKRIETIRHQYCSGMT